MNIETNETLNDISGGALNSNGLHVYINEKSLRTHYYRRTKFFDFPLYENAPYEIIRWLMGSK